MKIHDGDIMLVGVEASCFFGHKATTTNGFMFHAEDPEPSEINAMTDEEKHSLKDQLAQHYYLALIKATSTSFYNHLQHD